MRDLAFFCVLKSPLRSLQFTSTAVTVSRIDSLGGFTKNVNFISKKSRYCSFLNILAAFVPFLSCTRPESCMRMFIVVYSRIACSYDDDVIFINNPWRCTFTCTVGSVFHAL